ncbi:MAG: tRNA (adenosine(37)-N6)-threonylcarbamoyltransferase complex ATPase subunit type 1 TsaE [Dehalococcoidia bacterium]|nr:tRNA (adenosine(37)-N6)-threonylcarbamoyltransferase complex ATPase subunit type 1 TsaE [Dehalococcoidia bacterium]
MLRIEVGSTFEVKPLKINSYSSEQTQLLGSHLGKLAQKGDVFLLMGDLGAGKTCLTQGITQGLGSKEQALSPSFVIVRQYHGRLPLYHIDLYRLDHIAEIVNLGLDEYLYNGGVCVVEWPERGLQLLPENNLLIKISYVPEDETKRIIHLEPKGEHYSELIRQLEPVLDKDRAWN